MKKYMQLELICDQTLPLHYLMKDILVKPSKETQSDNIWPTRTGLFL